jgi:hypothetical protein
MNENRIAILVTMLVALNPVSKCNAIYFSLYLNCERLIPSVYQCERRRSGPLKQLNYVSKVKHA